MHEIAQGSHRFVVYEMRIRFRTPARLGERLEIRTGVERTSGYRVTFRQQATRAGGSTTLANADVDVVSLDASGMLQELPAELSPIWTAGGR
jgi:acyl-CoA thioesterase FadM